jgi:hypothetical protein
MKAPPLLSSVIVQLAILCATASLSFSQTNLQSSDGYIRRDGSDLVIGTSLAEKRIRLANGQLLSTSLRNKKAGREYGDDRTNSPEIRFAADGQDVTASGWGWQLRDERAIRGAQGELELDISLTSPKLQATKHYVIYPGTAVIREWLTIRNESNKPVRISKVSFWHTNASGAKNYRFNYVTGGGNFNGSQLLKSEPMGASFQRTIDSNAGTQPGAYSGYLPLIFLSNPQASEGVAVGWDYMGHWLFQIGDNEGNAVTMQLELAGFEKDLPPGGQMETPKAFTAPFSGGLDELGNQLLDWQYAYLWDFTNPDYFAKTRWAVDWPDPWIGDGGTPSADNWGRRLALDLRYVDLHAGNRHGHSVGRCRLVRQMGLRGTGQTGSSTNDLRAQA